MRMLSILSRSRKHSLCAKMADKLSVGSFRPAGAEEEVWQQSLQDHQQLLFLRIN